MKFDFTKLEETAIDFKAVALEIRTAEREARAILETIDERLSGEKAEAEAKRAKLQAQIDDTSRAATLRRMAQAELDGMSGKTFEPLPLEKEAFDDCLSELETAVADLVELRRSLTLMFTDATKALAELRANTIASQSIDPELIGRTAGNLRKDYSALETKWCT